MNVVLSKKLPKLVWEPQNLIIYVIKGTALGNGSNKIEPELKIKMEIGRTLKTLKTQAIKSADPLWDKYFYIDTIPSSMTFIVKDIRNKLDLGHAQLNLGNLDPDVVKEFKLKLEPKKEKYRERTTGDILIRILFSNTPDLRILNTLKETEYYFYSEYIDNFKTGDLILYSGRTVLDATSKLRTGKPFSHVGVILKILNPLTHHYQLYVVEVTRNLDQMIDAWHQGLVNGISVFRLEERIHQYYGSGIWWLPLKEPMSVPQEQSMLRWLTHMHLRQAHYNTGLIDPVLPPNFAEFLKLFNLYNKYPQSITELWGPIFVLMALEAGHVVVGPQTLITEEIKIGGDKGKNQEGIAIWYCMVRRQWIPYSAEVSEKLELYYRKSNHPPFSTFSCTIEGLLVPNDSYSIDFISWKQINNVSKHERDIKREVTKNPSFGSLTTGRKVLVASESIANITGGSRSAFDTLDTMNIAPGSFFDKVPSHDCSLEDKKNLTIASLLSLSVYESNPVLLFCIGSCFEDYQATKTDKTEQGLFTPKPNTMFVVTPNWNKPLPLSEKLEKGAVYRKQRLEEMRKQQEAMNELDDSGSEVLLNLLDDGEAVSEEMQKNTREKTEENPNPSLTSTNEEESLPLNSALEEVESHNEIVKSTENEQLKRNNATKPFESGGVEYMTYTDTLRTSRDLPTEKETRKSLNPDSSPCDHLDAFVSPRTEISKKHGHRSRLEEKDSTKKKPKRGHRHEQKQEKKKDSDTPGLSTPIRAQDSKTNGEPISTAPELKLEPENEFNSAPELKLEPENESRLEGKSEQIPNPEGLVKETDTNKEESSF